MWTSTAWPRSFVARALGRRVSYWVLCPDESTISSQWSPATRQSTIGAMVRGRIGQMPYVAGVSAMGAGVRLLTLVPVG